MLVGSMADPPEPRDDAGVVARWCHTAKRGADVVPTARNPFVRSPGLVPTNRTEGGRAMSCATSFSFPRRVRAYPTVGQSEW